MLLKSRYRNYIFVQLVVVAVVIGIFKVISNKQIASMFASSLFIGSALGILWNEFKHPHPLKRPSVWGTSIFLVFSALPVFLLRVLNWGVDFSEVSFMGLTGVEMHKMSNYFFILMLLGFFIDSYLLVLNDKSRD